ncbi:MAG: M48 family metallopeptidase [Chloroflexi bacterium]|nr:M48 family metallopeptidase [Chloroflexota bacterium]
MVKIDQVFRTKRKSIALIIQRDGRLIVRAPLHTSDKSIRSFVEKNTAWIKAKQAQVKTAYPQVAPKKYIDGEKFWYLGRQYPLQIVDRLNPPVKFFDRFFIDRSAVCKAQWHLTQWYKKQARRVISERVKIFAAKNGFAYRQVKITSAQTRWGSCSSKGSLCFSWRLIMAPLPVIDYVVIHELVHLKEKNHGKSFWEKVNTLMPDYKQKIAWLKKNGPLLQI